MEFLIITGLSGAGKTRAADVLEDLDYYCVDNMPVALMTRFAELCLDTRGRFEKVALVTDIRDREGFGMLLDTVEELKQMDCSVRILYMDADVPTLVRRYKESRRPHPLAEMGMTTEQAVQREEELEEFLAFMEKEPEMTADLQKVIDADRQELTGNFCRGCGYCMPCPEGIIINQCARISLMVRRAPSAAWTNDFWQAEMKKIENCRHCGKCMEHCPYELNTPGLLQRNYEDYKKILAGTVSADKAWSPV